MSGLIELASQVKGVVSAQRIKRENAAFLMVSKLAVAFCLVAILLLALNSYFGERIHCFDTTKGKEAPGKHVHGMEKYGKMHVQVNYILLWAKIE